MDDRAVRERVARVEGLLEQLERVADPVARGTALETVQALVELYGEGLARLMERVVANHGALAPFLAEDELVGHLLLLHGLHPVSLEERIGAALEEVRPYLRSHGGNVELLRVAEGVAYLRLQGSCSGCPSSSATLRLAIEEAVQRTAPDLDRIEAEGVAEPPRAGFVPVASLGMNGSEGSADRGGWTVVGSLPQLASGGSLLKEVAGEPVLFLSLEHAYYAYRPACPGCGESLAGGTVAGAELACPGCRRRYDVRRAGRCLDSPRLFLDPLPLLVADSGVVKVAVPASVG